MKPGKNDVLLVIDVQNDFCPGGALAVPDGDSVVSDINRMAGDFGHCVMTQDWHPAGHSSFATTHSGKAPFSTITVPYGEQTLWPDHCIQGTQGAEFHPGLHLKGAEMIIRKGYNPGIDSYSAFFENDRRTPTGLAGYLAERGLRRVFCVGLATDFCVRFSAEDARKLGLETVVVLGACRGIDLGGSMASGLEAMKAAGVTLMDRI
jgi:nicotinamidase/pyrazinamidase